MSKLHLVKVGILSLLACCEVAIAKDYLLHIAVEDGVSFNEADIQDELAFLKKELPEFELESIKVWHADVFDFIPGGRLPVSLKLQARIEEFASKLQTQDQVRLFVIATHGGSDNSGMSLGFFGGIDASGATPVFEMSFAPLIGKLAPDARIVFSSCSTMCGDAEVVSQRIQSIFEYFKIPAASLFAFHTSSHGLSGKYSKPRLFGKVAISTGLAGLVVSGVVAMTGAENVTVWPAIGFAIAGGGLSLLLNDSPRQPQEGMNLGKVYKMIEGQIFSSAELNFYEHQREAFGIVEVACDQPLIGSPH